MDSRTAPAQLAKQPLPFVLKLPVGDANALCGSRAAEFGSVECVTASSSLGIDQRKVTVDGGTRRRTTLKSDQLRMLTITVGAAAKDLPGEQRLAPKRDKPLRVEIHWMKRPESHGRSDLGTGAGLCVRLTLERVVAVRIASAQELHETG